MALVHSGPWTQLPPAPPPVPTSRFKSVSNLPGSCNKPKAPPPNPFEEEQEEDCEREAAEPESEDLNKPLVAPVHLENISFEFEENKEKPAIPQKSPDLREGGEVAEADPVEGVTADTKAEGPSSEGSGDGTQIVSSDLTEAAGAAGPTPTAASKQSDILHRSLSVPAITSDYSDTLCVPVTQTEVDEAFASGQSKVRSEIRLTAEAECRHFLCVTTTHCFR